MESSSNSQSESNPQFKIPSDWLLSLATTPMILVLGGSKLLAETLLDLSQTSEEVFRGDRLPVLKFPKSPSEADNGEG